MSANLRTVSQAGVPRTSACPTSVSRAHAGRMSVCLRTGSATNAGQPSACWSNVSQRALCCGGPCWRLQTNRAHPFGGCGPLTPGRLHDGRKFPGCGGCHYRRPSAEDAVRRSRRPIAGGVVRRAGRDVLPTAGCPSALRPQPGHGWPGLRHFWSPDEVQPDVAPPDAGDPRAGLGPHAGSPGWWRPHGRLGRILGAHPGQVHAGLGPRPPAGLEPNLRTYPGQRRRDGLCDGPEGRRYGDPGRFGRFGPGCIRPSLPRSARRAASSGSRRLLHVPWVSPVPQPRLPASSFHTTQASEEGRSTVSGSDPLQACPAASYSPTRSPAQYHRR